MLSQFTSRYYIFQLTYHHWQVVASVRDSHISEPEYVFAEQSSTVNVYSKIDRDPLIGTWALIKKGPYKGYHGIIKTTRNSIVQIELEAGLRVVTVEKDIVLNRR